MPVHDKILKKKLQYMLSGTDCDVFKGGTHHGALGLNLRFSTLRTSYRARRVFVSHVGPVPYAVRRI